jgi:hypothetical protein
MSSSPTSTEETDSGLRLGALLDTIKQGDVISFGAIAIVGTHASKVFREAKELTPTEITRDAKVASMTIEYASGWYAVLSQDCDIVRTIDVEPCILIAPVVYIPEAEWDQLEAGQTSYRFFALQPDRIVPLPQSDSALRVSRKPVVDVRYVTSVDKTAMPTAQNWTRSTPLVPDQRRRFAQWLGSRFARYPFADGVVKEVLPQVRTTLEVLSKQRSQPDAEQRTAAVRFVGCIREWYVREMELNVEIMGRLDHGGMRAEKILKTLNGEPVVDEAQLRAGANALRKAIVARMPRTVGYAISVTYHDFNVLDVAQYETYSLWIVQDDPEASEPRMEVETNLAGLATVW